MSNTGTLSARWSWLRLPVAAALIGIALAAPATGAPQGGTILYAGGPNAVDGEFVVALKNTIVARDGVDVSARYLAERYGGLVDHTYHHALRGFSVRLSDAAARRLAADPSVKYVQQNHAVHITGTQTPTPSWGLARIGQRTLPLGTAYAYPTVASNVRAYVIDTGIRLTHREFVGRATSGRDTVDKDDDASDCHGHGTHVAATIGGATFGVAKGVTLVGVRVLNCRGSGSLAGVIAGIDWVTGDHDPGEPAVANMSLGSMFDKATNDAVAASIADGVTYAVAAGNDYGSDACYVSPASSPNAVTVGATQSDDVRAPYSNVGGCVDLFAPGTDITSAWGTGDTATLTISGTSMASPHVTGAAALVASANPSFTPQQVRDRLVADATLGVLVNPGEGSPNRLLHVGAGGAPADRFLLAPTPSIGVTDPGDWITTTVATAPVGNPQPVRLYATDLPAGAAASFIPSTVTSGESAILTITTTSTTPPGSYPVMVVGTSASELQFVTYTLVVNSAPFCSATNAVDVAVPDLSTAESVVTIAGCAINVASVSTVELHLVHTHQGDLAVSLVAPDGAVHLLQKATGDGVDNIDQIYTVNLSGKPIEGEWRLRVQDSLEGDVGYINSWTLSLGTALTWPGCTGENGADTAIPDASIVESTIELVGCMSGRASHASLLELHIVHPYQRDLIVKLVAPNGAVYPMHRRAGGSAPGLDQISTVDLSSEQKGGIWRLIVEDVAVLDVGYIDSWRLTL